MRFIAGICTLNSRFDPGPLHVEYIYIYIERERERERERNQITF